MHEPLVVFVSYGSYGDINPLLAIAQRLTSHCQVVFASNEFYRAHVEKAGIQFHGAGSIEEQQSCSEMAELSGRTMDGLMHQFRTHVGKNISRLSNWLESLHRGRKIMVVTHGTLNPIFPICEKLRIPVVRAYLAPSHLPLNKEDFILEETFYGCSPWRAKWSRYPRHALNIKLFGPAHARREYNQFRADAGFAAEQLPYQALLSRLFAGADPKLNVVAELLLTPEWFAEPMTGLEHVHCTGFPYYDTAAYEPPKLLKEFIAQYGSPIVFTPGTGVADIARFCAPIESICRKLQRPGILLAKHGATVFRTMQRVLNHPVIHVEFADMRWLLSRSSLLIHTGGIGTIAQAVRSGIPQIIYPMMNDQHKNALRVLLNGLGGMIYENGYNSEHVARVVGELINSDHHQSCLAHYTAQIKIEDGAERAASLLLEVVNKLPSLQQVTPTATSNFDAVPLILD